MAKIRLILCQFHYTLLYLPSLHLNPNRPLTRDWPWDNQPNLTGVRLRVFFKIVGLTLSILILGIGSTTNECEHVWPFTLGKVYRYKILIKIFASNWCVRFLMVSKSEDSGRFRWKMVKTCHLNAVKSIVKLLVYVFALACTSCSYGIYLIVIL